ncbi:hypothetical protein P3T76_004244 [Phytophthora citrophthora]|uniref:Uncharacterized protein n=1 Tax=Phytophthora citrophthora TaxID=4793 RepID=A0AAD9LR62_9STRA|nr:hypothetical protein P3T76_004244 [Phytophthora citrophthora]
MTTAKPIKAKQRDVWRLEQRSSGQHIGTTKKKAGASANSIMARGPKKTIVGMTSTASSSAAAARRKGLRDKPRIQVGGPQGQSSGS